MKRILMFLLLLVGLVACTDRTAKYTDSLNQVTDAVAAATAITTEITDIQTLISSIDLNNLSTANATELYNSLLSIQTNLDNEIVQSVVSAYLDQNDFALNVDLGTIESQITSVPDGNWPPDAPTKTEVTALMTSLLTTIQGL